MENASKALEIAAGVLLAVLIMSLVAYFFTSISEWPQQQDDEKEAEQTAKFNLEYEVYDKKGMYGADVISCLTKAENNNEKYYDGGSFLSGYKYGVKFPNGPSFDKYNAYALIISIIHDSFSAAKFSDAWKPYE